MSRNKLNIITTIDIGRFLYFLRKGECRILPYYRTFFLKDFKTALSIYTLLSVLTVIFAIFVRVDICHAKDVNNNLIEEFRKVNPDKVIIIDTLKPVNIPDFVYYHFLKSPQLNALALQDKSLEHSIASIRQIYKPNLKFSLEYNDYDSYYREVIVNTSVPVKWDAENPIISNITLPNGGQGIIWLPRPLVWEVHDIPLNASLDYRSHVANSNVTMNYLTDFGLQINALSYDLSYRFEPKTYGFPWSSKINTNFYLPLAKNFGYWGNSPNVNMELSELDRQITNVNYRSLKNSVTADILSNYIQLYLDYKKLESLRNMQEILSVQVEDIDLLTEDKRVTVSDNISMKSKLRNIRFQINYLLNNIFMISSRLNPEYITSDTTVLYIPANIDLDSLINRSNRIIAEKLAGSEIRKMIDEHPQTEISALRLEQSNISLKYAENQNLPDISLMGNVGTFQVNNLGFKQPWDSWKHVFYKPDGITWYLGFQYYFPLGNSQEENYLSAMAEKEVNREYLENSKQIISDKLKQHVYFIENARDAIKNSIENFTEVKEMLDKQASPLFESKRMNRYDYYSYRNELENAGMMINDSYSGFFRTFFGFASDMNMDLNTYMEGME